MDGRLLRGGALGALAVIAAGLVVLFLRAESDSLPRSAPRVTEDLRATARTALEPRGDAAPQGSASTPRVVPTMEAAPLTSHGAIEPPEVRATIDVSCVDERGVPVDGAWLHLSR